MENTIDKSNVFQENGLRSGLAQIVFVFESMASAVEHKQSVVRKKIPEITGFAKIQKEIADLQNALGEKQFNK
ncbi:hypothetical protein [Neobacillus vireti]|uniref:LXG domain-containing protein n=1 Tax=Neobacillus vireti LMG 21834 TaxID=1131730 RepID=A0AB94IR97_9BACI|nr:hypothetical protein [Neobacillus vireti]ETI69620.1 hypothetical protein BAVI_06869 [Neobacillus vireti LMG 21834]KLT15926.1 hypothetical protein AA980_22295 [Neobacillus vireti]